MTEFMIRVPFLPMWPCYLGVQWILSTQYSTAPSRSLRIVRFLFSPCKPSLCMKTDSKTIVYFNFELWASFTATTYSLSLTEIPVVDRMSEQVYCDLAFKYVSFSAPPTPSHIPVWFNRESLIEHRVCFFKDILQRSYRRSKQEFCNDISTLAILCYFQASVPRYNNYPYWFEARIFHPGCIFQQINFVSAASQRTRNGISCVVQSCRLFRISITDPRNLSGMPAVKVCMATG